jgi:redox-sensitive bicupin YhaK (pirin superfamily)
MPAGTQLTQAIPVGHNAFTYTYRGSVMIAGTEVPDRNMALLANDGGEAVRVEAKVDARLLLIAGKPLGEPIVQYGPFVMNTKQEIMEAIEDFQAGKFGYLE